MERRLGINFDRFVRRFQKNIYGTAKGDLRQQIVWQHMLDTLPLTNRHSLQILDIGCGTAPFAKFLLQQGHQLTLCDISAEMLQQARQQLQGVAGQESIRYIHAPLQSLSEHLDGQQFDVIMAHALIEWLPDNAPLLQLVSSLLSDAGYFSLLFYNRNSLIFRNMQLGNWKRVKFEWLRGRGNKTLTPICPQDPYTLYEQLTSWQLPVIDKAGVRVFYDYLDRSTDKSDMKLLFEMEHRYSRHEPFLSLARYIHVVCQKSGTSID